MSSPRISVWLSSLAGLVPVPGPLVAAALLLRHRGVKGRPLDAALRFIARRRTARGCSYLIDEAAAAEVDAALPVTWGWAAEGWELMRPAEAPEKEVA